MLVARPGAAPRMIGRRSEFVELHRLLASSRAQGPAVAVVTGEAGVGKSRLLREFIATVGSAHTVVAGQAHEAGAARGFALVRAALEDHLDSNGRLPQALARWHHPLGHLLAPLVVVADHPDDGHSHGEEELVRAAVALIGHLVGNAPALVAFEDLQWADEESLEVFASLARSDLPILLVGTFRPEDFDRRLPLAGLLATLERQHSVTHLSVDRLSRAELAEFLEQVFAGPVSADVVDRLHRRTAGNPFFVEELLATALPQPRDSSNPREPAASVLVDAPLPWSTGEAVLRRLDTYDASTRKVLAAAAVLGERFDLNLLAGVTGSDHDLVDMLEPLVRTGVLEDCGPEVFAFRHVLVREAITEELLARDRRAVHERALDWLVAKGDPEPARAAYHASEAGRQPEAAEFARRAAERALQEGAPRETLRLATRALSFYEHDLPLHRLASFAAAKVGELDTAVAHARQWAAAARTKVEVAEQARANCQLAWTLWLISEPEAAWEAIGAAAQVAAESDGSTQAEIAATHAQLLGATGRPREAVEKAELAIELASQANNRRVRAVALAMKVAALVDSPTHQEPAGLAEVAELQRRARAESAAIGDVENEARALHTMLLPDQPVDLSLEENLEIVRQGRELADRYGLERFAGKLTVLETFLHMREANMAEAHDTLTAARRASLAPKEAIWRERLAGLLRLGQGDLEGAHNARTTQWELLADRESAESLFDIVALEAALAADSSAAAMAKDALERAGEHVASVCPCVGSDWWGITVGALDAGVEATAVREAADRYAPTPLPRHAGLVAYATGCLHAAER